jgi:hypothetical protein
VTAIFHINSCQFPVCVKADFRQKQTPIEGLSEICSLFTHNASRFILFSNVRRWSVNSPLAFRVHKSTTKITERRLLGLQKTDTGLRWLLTSMTPSNKTPQQFLSPVISRQSKATMWETVAVEHLVQSQYFCCSRLLTKGHRGSGCIAPPILNHTLEWREWSASRSSRFTPGERALVHTEQEAGLAPVWECRRDRSLQYVRIRVHGNIFVLQCIPRCLNYVIYTRTRL